MQTIDYAPTILTLAVAGSGALVGGVVYAAARWGARQARTVRALAGAGEQLVVVRPVVGGVCTPLSLPERFADLFVERPRPEAFTPGGAPLPLWRVEVDGAVEALRARVLAAPTRSAAAACEVEGRRLQLLGTLLGGGRVEGADLLVVVREMGADSVRVNRLETAAFLSGGVVHDLNNLLNTLVMHAELGRERAEAAPQAAAHFERIRAASRRATELTGLIRRYLREDGTAAGGGAGGARDARAPQRVPVRVAAAVDEVVGLLRPAIPRRVRVELELDPTAVVAGEPVHLHQIVSNLVLNAVQALAQSGRDDARVRVVVTSTPRAHGGGEVELTVTDNGPGLPAAVRERCFEPFFTTKVPGDGTGLGLAVVHALVTDALGGTVTAEDAPGGGALFRIRIPTLGRP
jgi:signal transduction histidine kinase